MAQRWPHFKCYKMDGEHKEGLGRQRDPEKKCSKGGRETEKRIGDTAFKSRGDLNRVNMSSEGQGTEAWLEGKEDRMTGLGHRYGLRKSSEATRGVRGSLQS